MNLNHSFLKINTVLAIKYRQKTPVVYLLFFHCFNHINTKYIRQGRYCELDYLRQLQPLETPKLFYY